MWPMWESERQRLAKELYAAKGALGLKGLLDAKTVDTLALQFVASLRREAYYKLLQQKVVSPNRADPHDAAFDAERAVAFHVQHGNVDEAAWLIFLMTHFARHPISKWRRLQDVYGALGQGLWDWSTVSANPAGFYAWIKAHWQHIKGAFGNHRKYESLKPDAKRSFALVVADYLGWIGAEGHESFFANAVKMAGNDPHTIFDYLYHHMTVLSFGRLAKLDYLSLIGRYGLAPVSAGAAYLDGATGPVRGAQLLVDGKIGGLANTAALQSVLDALDLQIKVGMTVMEDALCNWQKSPSTFVHFIG